MAQYLNFCIRRFFQTSAIRQSAKAGAGENHDGKSRFQIDKHISFGVQKIDGKV